ncbi:RagB/SusD family nutrient uptake outer membrane protein [uncultured Draconibacterium sp.]|uniref:RagB/SusD family nutrient uptake outer membrane protein n=1 Tax=uncultured Draconibacterium sp. TaxID=1573823 RepID=UPI002AA91F6C|nr:RagB/SusD family nutrient uptake outer membrane protein [uncultured Draconibacterium sp.]
MKLKIVTILSFLIVLVGCNDLDLNPLAEGATGNWYSDETEIEMSLNDLYRDPFWKLDNDYWTDDWIYRGTTNSITGGTMNGEDRDMLEWWSHTYKGVTRANTVIQSLDNISNAVSEDKLNQYKADARFCRAGQNARLITHWGDAIYSNTIMSLEESFNMERTDKEVILQGIYEDYDFAATYLPESYGTDENKHATKGAALAMKARIALYMEDYETARDAAKACMDLGVYELYPSYRELFLSSTKNSVETIFALPRSEELGNYRSDCQNFTTRNAGGWASHDPSWELFCAFLCTDGLPIDESPLFDPHNPFKNRDPRCAETIVAFQSEHLGYMYQPHPDSLTVLNFNSGQYVTNNDTKSNAAYASFNGLAWRKGIDTDWSDNKRTDPDKIIMRYADVLLMYAEAKIELNEIDESVFDAINQVRARAYGVSVDDVANYPAVTVTDQAELRKELRIERRMELAFEGRRYMDLMRWKLAEKTLNIPTYGLLDVAELREKVVNQGLWFFPETPEIDEDGIADFSPMYNAGLIKLLGLRTFDASKQYLWPIPSKEILINENLVQNEGY